MVPESNEGLYQIYLDVYSNPLVLVIVDSDGFGYAHGSIGMVELPQAQLGQNMAYCETLIHERHAFQGTSYCGVKRYAIDDDSDLLAIL